MLDFIGAVLIGMTAGVASGVAGIGGGVILVPGMVFLLKSNQHVAQGTSLFAIIFTALSGTRVNLAHDRVAMGAVAWISVIGAVTAFGAARLANQLDAELLRRLFGLFLLFFGTRMLIDVWRIGRLRTRGRD